MKTFMLFLCLVGGITAFGQCQTTRLAYSYYAIPTFFGLYFSNQCISQPIHDTTICVKVAQTNQTQVAAFSYSSPSGLPAFITNVRQYNSQCIMYEMGSMIPSGTDTITICYDIQAQLIDNFCPYTILSGSLSVDWGGIYAYYSEGTIKMQWLTLTNSGTDKFEVITSTDAMNWSSLVFVNPIQETSSSELSYKVCIPFGSAGGNYFAVREYDLNGKVKVSDIVFCEVPESVKNSPAYDILGRVGSNTKYTFYIGK